MRHRSKTNSRPMEDTALRDHYRDQNGTCELSRWMARHYRAGLTDSDFRHPSAEVNHIFSLGRRPDLWSNLITLSSPVHRWFHANLSEGRLLCLWMKYRKNELDLGEFREASGKRLEGWLLMNETNSAWLSPLWEELLVYGQE